MKIMNSGCNLKMSFLAISTILAIAGCAGKVQPKGPTPEESLKAAREKQKALEIKHKCAEAREGLPTIDPGENLKGQIIYDGGNGINTKRDIIQFGRDGRFFSYVLNTEYCGRFYLWEVSSLTKAQVDGKYGKSDGFDVVLKNGKKLIASSTALYFYSNGSLNAGITNDDTAAASDFSFRFMYKSSMTKAPAEGYVARESQIRYLRID